MFEVVAIIGPTGVGKTRLAIQLAQEFNGEIVNADSRQVYRHMDIGTAKPTAEERVLVPHHLLDLVDPDGDFNLATYQRLAYTAIGDIHRRGKLPFLVGGTGQYVWAVLEGWVVPEVAPDLEFRRTLERRAAEGGARELYDELHRLDPDAAQKIDPRNVRRVIRALEVRQRSGQLFSALQNKNPPPFQPLILGLTMERKKLYERVDARVEEMMERGLVDEVKSLLAMGYSLSLPSMSGIGYREIGRYLRGEMTLEEAIYRIKVGTHRFIRHQYAWFRRDDGRIRWVEAREAVDDVLHDVKTLLIDAVL